MIVLLKKEPAVKIYDKVSISAWTYLPELGTIRLLTVSFSHITINNALEKASNIFLKRFPGFRIRIIIHCKNENEEKVLPIYNGTNSEPSHVIYLN